MFNFEKGDFQRFAISSVGALAMSAACVFAAVGPAKAATPNAPLTIADWQRKVTDRVEAIHEGNVVYQPNTLMASELAVRFTADGDFAGAVIARSSGNRQVDERAVNVARLIAYPPLPQGLHRAPAAIRMVLYFGNSADAAADYAAKQDCAAKNIQLARADEGNGIQIAAR